VRKKFERKLAIILPFLERRHKQALFGGKFHYQVPNLINQNSRKINRKIEAEKPPIHTTWFLLSTGPISEKSIRIGRFCHPKSRQA
jgi:hypothetical protein